MRHEERLVRKRGDVGAKERDRVPGATCAQCVEDLQVDVVGRIDRRRRHPESRVEVIVPVTLLKAGVGDPTPEQMGDHTFGGQHHASRLPRVAWSARHHAVKQVGRVLVGSLQQMFGDRRLSRKGVGLHRVVTLDLLRRAEPQEEAEFWRAAKLVARPDASCVPSEFPVSTGAGVAILPQGAGRRMRVRIIHAQDLDVLREALLKRRHRVGAHADGMHLVGATLPRFSCELPRDDVQQFVREDLVHRAEATHWCGRLVEVDVAHAGLRRAVKDEAEPREAALLRRQQKVCRFRRRPRFPPQVLLFQRVEPEQTARKTARKDSVNLSRRTPDQHRQSFLGGSRRRKHHQWRRRAQGRGRNGQEETESKPGEHG